MAELSTIARPYAEAAFSAAAEAGSLDSWLATLDRLAVVAADPSVQASVTDPRLPVAKQVELFASFASGADAGLLNFIQALADNARLTVLPEIASQFRDLKAAREESAEAIVVSAFPLDDGDLGRLVESLEKRFGRKIKPQVSVDNALIGGVTVRVGDEVIDASVRGQLAAMDTALRN
jgi:F-type H+-transporting ATPase subunit delta